MCYDDNASPPVPPGPGGAAQGEDLVLTAADGTRFAAYAARPANPTGAQILIYPDVRGLHQFYKDLALRFAETGVQAVAVDYFGRTAGLTSRAEPFDYMPHVQQMELPHVYADTRAALDYLRAGTNGANRPFLVGFCRGGSLALLAGGQAFGFAGLIVFYSGLSRNIGEGGTVLEQADRVKYPVLGLFGGADQGIPPEDVQALDRQLDKAGVAHEIVTYPGAPHSFFDRRATDFAQESSDAWRRMLDFIAGHVAAPA
jgi:carboxymethylenebutenolidase